MIPLLAPIFHGPLASHGEALVLSPVPPVGSIPVSDLLDDAAILLSALRQHADRLYYSGGDLRPVASSWSMAYLAALLPPVCAAATLLRHVFPVGAANTCVTLGPDGAAASFHIPDVGETTGSADTAARYAPLVFGHLAPLFEALHARTRLPLKILWGNAARHLLGIFDIAGQLAPGMPLIAHDSALLLHSPTWPTAHAESSAPGRNPLWARDRTVILLQEGAATEQRLHRQCCLFYKLPGLGYCGACPLDPRYQGMARREPDSAATATQREPAT